MKELESVVWVMFRREEREERKGKGFWFSKLLIYNTNEMPRCDGYL
jgi:hypothetical protein